MTGDSDTSSHETQQATRLCERCGRGVSQDQRLCAQCVIMTGQAPPDEEVQASVPSVIASSVGHVRWDFGAPAMLSGVIPGFGQLYKLEFIKGCAFFFGQTIIITAFLMLDHIAIIPFAVFLQFWCVIDAARVFERGAGFTPAPKEHGGVSNSDYRTNQDPLTYQGQQNEVKSFSNIRNRRREQRNEVE